MKANRKSKISSRSKKVLKKYKTFNDTLHSNFANLNINININKSPKCVNQIYPVKIPEDEEKNIVDPPISTALK